MIIDEMNSKHLIADVGMVLVRKVGTRMTGKNVILGKVTINGELVDDKAEYWKEVSEDSIKPRERKDKHNNGEPMNEEPISNEPVNE